MPDSAPAPPSRRVLRARLFWAARWLLGGPVYHPAGIRITIDDGSPLSGETLVIRPRPDDEQLGAGGPPTNSAAPLAPALLAAFLSADALALMRFVAARQPVAGKTIAAAAADIERSRCYVLLGDLRDRGLIRDTGDGYEVGDTEFWAAVAEARGE